MGTLGELSSRLAPREGGDGAGTPAADDEGVAAVEDISSVDEGPTDEDDATGRGSCTIGEFASRLAPRIPFDMVEAANEADDAGVEEGAPDEDDGGETDDVSLCPRMSKRKKSPFLPWRAASEAVGAAEEDDESTEEERPRKSKDSEDVAEGVISEAAEVEEADTEADSEATEVEVVEIVVDSSSSKRPRRAGPVA